MNKKQQAFVRAAGEALFGKDEKWLAPMARAIGNNVYERQLRRALADEPEATLDPKDFTRLRTLLQQRQRLIETALAKFEAAMVTDKAAEKEAA